MPRQTELADLRVTLGRDYSTLEHLYPLVDRTLNTRYFVLDLGEGKVMLIEPSQMRKIGEDITVSLTTYSSNMASVNPMVFLQTLHLDPWGVLAKCEGISEETQKSLMATNLFGRKVGGKKVCDIFFHEDLEFVEKVELCTMGISKKVHPVSDLEFLSDGNLRLKPPPA